MVQPLHSNANNQNMTHHGPIKGRPHSHMVWHDYTTVPDETKTTVKTLILLAVSVSQVFSAQNHLSLCLLPN